MADEIPKVGMVLANYNNANFVLDALKSCINQTYQNKVVLLVDDCSTDNSLQVINDFLMESVSKEDGLFIQKMRRIGENEHYTLDIFEGFPQCPIFLFALRKNVGRGGVRNFPLEFGLANNFHLFQIIDADDIMYPEKVQKLVDVLIQDPENIGIVYADYHILNEEGILHYEAKPPYSFQQLFAGQNMIHSGALINGLALKKNGLYDPVLRCCEDLSLWIRIVKHFIALNLAIPLTMARSHKADSTASLPKEVWQQDFQRAMAVR